ncbi:glycosyltransferase family 4 protein [bacterium]|nr:glycosyltransferase family 4 protein [bacterium]
MKIAIPVPSPVPFSPGGIEKLTDGLATALTAAGHQVEVIKLPAPENSSWDILKSYWRFSRIDLRHFDLVISLKYPGWMIRSRNHICYMCHRLRGLYDTYPYSDGLGAFLKGPKFKFPGPVIRRLVHWLDDFALQRDRASHFFCLSETVKRRVEYFPKGGYEPVVLYPPSSLPGLSGCDYEYFFSVSRLDAPKRMDLLISAMAHVKEDVRLLIAGDGPQRPYLEALSSSDPRVELLGSVTDERLASLYSNSLAVLFVPVQEDYGLVTVEAMRCGKPVITCEDSGGPPELVKDGVNGFVCPPDARAVAAKLSLLAQSPDLAEKLGRNGLKTVSSITWENLVNSLLEPYNFLQLDFGKSRQNKRLVCVLSPYGIFPPVGGGKSRIFHLYGNLARHYNVVVISVGNYDEPYMQKEIAEGLFELRIPMTPAHSQKQWRLEEEAGLPISDVAMPNLMKESPMIGKVIEHFVAKADVVVASHPFLFDAIRRRERTRLVVYEAHNIETKLKAESLSGTKVGRRLMRLTKSIESRACRSSDLVWATSELEAGELASFFGMPSEKVWVVPNAVDTRSIAIPSEAQASAAREELKLGPRPIVLFLASWHPPNLDGLLFLKEHLSPALPNHDIVVIGSVKDQHSALYGNLDFPDNLKVLGVVDEKIKNLYLAAADIAINPVATGSGTNLKMFDYMASGLPIVTTPVGARGTAIVKNQHALVCDRDSFADKIKLLRERKLAASLGASARKLAEERFDWAKIADDLHEKLELAMPSPLPASFDASSAKQFISGWYASESWESKFMFRWSNGQGRLRVMNPKSEAILRLQVLKGATPDITVLANGHSLGTFPLSDGWQEITAKLPRIIDGDAIDILLKTAAWRPADIAGGNDVRRLGIALREASVTAGKIGK